MMNKRTIGNILSLYGFSFAKIVLPLITLPYLTRVLSVESYGLVAYTRSLIGYFQLFIDFGFVLSGTKKIVKFQDDRRIISGIIGDIMIARILLAVISFPVLVLLSLIIPVFKGNELYLYLSFIPVFLTIFLFDFVFRGLEKMHLLTLRFFIMKGIATALTFVFVHQDIDVLWIPVLDIIGSIIAIIFVLIQLKKEELAIRYNGFKSAMLELKDSAVFFISNMSQTVFSALNTIIIGVFLSVADVAFWSLCIQMVTAVQTMYQPITDGIYPQMVSTKNINVIKKILKFFMPIIGVGCIFTLIVSRYALIVVGGAKYADAENVLRLLVPVMFFGFPCIIFGWPTLGAINKDRQVTISTIIGAAFQIICLLVLGLIGRFNLITIAICRSLTEMLLFAIRYVTYRKYRTEFVTQDSIYRDEKNN